MPFEQYVYSGTRRLRCGYTTGTCAALAAGAAAAMLAGQKQRATARLATPSGALVEVDLHQPFFCEESAVCAVQKDGGDDIDATHGLMICAEARFIPAEGVTVTGGTGVGRVTKPGLDQPVGEYAINRVPRRMIQKAVEDALAEAGCDRGVEITISVPDGEKTAPQTFNRQLGIEGGISILGTSGIVAPRSLEALRDSVEVEIRQQAACENRNLILTPGNYGADFVKTYPYLGRVPVVSCSNFIGDALDVCARYPFERVLLVGHIGKMVKLAGGVMNTHSRIADCRGELFCAHAALAGADRTVLEQLMHAATTDACIQILRDAGWDGPVLDSLIDAIQARLNRRVAGAFACGAVVFSNTYGLLRVSRTARRMIEEMEEGT